MVVTHSPTTLPSMGARGSHPSNIWHNEKGNLMNKEDYFQVVLRYVGVYITHRRGRGATYIYYVSWTSVRVGDLKVSEAGATSKFCIYIRYSNITTTHLHTCVWPTSKWWWLSSSTHSRGYWRDASSISMCWLGQSLRLTAIEVNLTYN